MDHALAVDPRSAPTQLNMGTLLLRLMLAGDATTTAAVAQSIGVEEVLVARGLCAGALAPSRAQAATLESCFEIPVSTWLQIMPPTANA